MKRGQITIFIIIGIILLLTVTLIIYLAQQRVVREVERPAVAKVPQEALPVHDMISDCIRQVGTEAIKRLGERGGYVDRVFAHNSFMPTEAEAVAFAEDSDLVIPYWWHMSSPNSCRENCRFESLMPALYEGPDSIESQITRYVSDNMRRCVGFDAFKGQGYIISELGPPDIKMTITPTDVFFSGEYPVRIEKGGAVTDLGEFYVPLDVNLKQAYDLAVELTKLEASGQMLEGGTKELITIFSGTDEAQLPPLADLKVTYDSPKFWIKTDVGKKVQSILSSHLSLIRAGSTRNYHYALSPNEGEFRELYEVVYNRQFFVPLNGSYPDYAFELVYLPWWKMYFDLNCNGQVCSADSANFPALGMFGLQEYSFAYDASYPALVMLRDPDAFDGEGFVFQFFLEANLRNNNPLRGATLLPPSDVEPSIVCNPDQFHSPELTVNVVDSTNAARLDDAVLTYRCGRSSCVMGKTENGVLVSRYPKCFDGILSAAKRGYMTGSGYLTTSFDSPVSIAVELTPKANVEVSASKFLLVKSGKHAPWKRVGELTPSLMDADEQVVIMLRREREGMFDEPFETVVSLNGPEKSGVLLSPGTYDVNIVAVKRPVPSLVIPVDRRCEEYPDPFWPFYSEVCYNLPEEPIVFDVENPLVVGGANLNVSIDVKEGSHVDFRYVAVAFDRVPERLRVIEDLNELGKFDMYSKALRSILKPVVT